MRYALHGFVVEASAPLSLLDETSASDDPTLSINVGPAQEPPGLTDASILYRVVFDDAGGVPYWTVARTDRGTLLRVHERADFWIRGGNIDVVPCPEMSWAVVEQVLVDLVAPRALHALGFPCLHASAVRLTSGKAVAFTAEAGTGKSTLCAALVARGGQLLSDDAIAPRIEARRLWVHPAYGSLRLWRDSTVAVFGHDDFPTAARHQKHRVACDRGEATSLEGLFVLEHQRAQVRPSRTRMTSSEALRKLAEGIHRLVADEPKACAAEFELLSELVARVPIFRLRFSHDYRALDAVVQLVEGA